MTKDTSEPEPYENGPQDNTGDYAEFSEGSDADSNGDDKKIVRLTGD